MIACNTISKQVQDKMEKNIDEPIIVPIKQKSKMETLSIAIIFISLILFTICILANVRMSVTGKMKCLSVNLTSEFDIIRKQINTHDPFDDLIKFLNMPESFFGKRPHEHVIVTTTISHRPKTIIDLLNMTIHSRPNNLHKFHMGINNHHLYPESDFITDTLLRDLAVLPFHKIEEKRNDTHFRLIVKYGNGMKAILKPMRFSRTEQTNNNHFHLSDFERANAEIAAFHLDRALGFRRAMPTIGRIIDMKTELHDIADQKLKKNIFMSPANNMCVYGTECSLYCDDDHAICSKNGHKMEVAVQAFLPEEKHFHVKKRVLEYPWKRSEDVHTRAKWQHNQRYCKTALNKFPYNVGRISLDLMDMAIFDFLLGNMNRHEFETFGVFHDNAYPLHLGNARGFGKPFHDDISILAPLYQCCKIRKSTLEKLLHFHNGPKKLSEIMEESMRFDPIKPILWKPHLNALDRRVHKILLEIRKCIRKHQLKHFN